MIFWYVNTFVFVGFLYMSPFLHQWLTATQYIAPLMANFDTSIGNSSHILYRPFGELEWSHSSVEASSLLFSFLLMFIFC